MMNLFNRKETQKESNIANTPEYDEPSAKKNKTKQSLHKVFKKTFLIYFLNYTSDKYISYWHMCVKYRYMSTYIYHQNNMIM